MKISGGYLVRVCLILVRCVVLGYLGCCWIGLVF